MTRFEARAHYPCVAENVSVEECELTPNPHNALLVRPSSNGQGSGVVFLHWFDEAPNANRTQFLDEAKGLAELGVTSILPQMVFPWKEAPSNAEDDAGRIEREVSYLENGLTKLIGTGVNPSKIALVGHDFGAMHGSLLMQKHAFAAGVLIAPTPRWADWFLRFWPISTERYEYMMALDRLDPINAVKDVKAPLLFQFAKNDFFIAPMTGLELMRDAGDPKELLSYEADHSLDLCEARNDRLAFLKRHLGF